ncbi:hypothetical protein [Citrobacter sp. Ce129]|uniref:hypothetical protein n=1 Tax=Citrobacter sp. Ce129 TaxID=2985043 RepID=UPI0025785113|nr:hypothetical protein [Citrobacter sp. Ce129]MDM3271619.1 hypothetical protein [Citrobacter sp. Ce129]
MGKKKPAEAGCFTSPGLFSPSLPKTILLPDIALAGNPSVLSRRRVSDYAIQRFSSIKTRKNFVIRRIRVLWFCISNAHNTPLINHIGLYCIFSASIKT